MRQPFITFLLLLITLLTALPVGAQDKQFKRDWTEFIEPVYINTGAMRERTPSGKASFKVYGFLDKQPVAADLTIEGTITEAQGERKKSWVINLKDAKVDLTDSRHEHLTFSGELTMALAWDKDTRYTTLKLTFGKGLLKLNDRYDTLAGDTSSEQSISINLDREYRLRPVIEIAESSVNLPSRITVNTPSPQVSSDIYATLGNYRVTDHDFIEQYFDDGLAIDNTTFPDYREHRTVYYTAPGSTDVDHYDIDSIAFGMIHTPLYDVNHYNNADYIDGKHLTAKFVNDSLIFANWNNGKEFAHFSGDTIMRQDASLLVGIAWDEDKLAARTGRNLAKVTWMGKVTDPEIYDFNEMAEASGISVREYVSPYGVSELIVDNVVPSIKRRVENAKREKEFLGPDRRLDNLRGHAMTCKVKSTDPEEGDNRLTSYTYEGLYAASDLGMTRDDDGYLVMIKMQADYHDNHDNHDIEITYTWNNGNMTRMVARGNRMSAESRFSYDADGNPVTRRYTISQGGIDKDGTIKYTYTLFDDHNNWTERQAVMRQSVVDMRNPDDEPLVNEKRWVETREINYFPPVEDEIAEPASDPAPTDTPAE